MHKLSDSVPLQFLLTFLRFARPLVVENPLFLPLDRDLFSAFKFFPDFFDVPALVWYFLFSSGERAFHAFEISLKMTVQM